jgi:hypothetical protein
MAMNQACEWSARLADDAHEPVLQISKNKTVNYHMQVSEWASRTRQDKISR